MMKMVDYKIFSPKDVTPFARSPGPAAHLLSGCLAFPQGPPSIEHSSFLNKPDRQDDDGDDQQDMNYSTHRVAAHQPLEP
jgi:hypothetical protein